MAGGVAAWLAVKREEDTEKAMQACGSDESCRKQVAAESCAATRVGGSAFFQACVSETVHRADAKAKAAETSQKPS